MFVGVELVVGLYVRILVSWLMVGFAWSADRFMVMFVVGCCLVLEWFWCLDCYFADGLLVW